MTVEIERKFLVTGPGWRRNSSISHSIRRAYLAQTNAAAVRVRIVDGARAFLTIKSAEPGTTRSEFEYEIPVAHGEALVRLRSGLMIEKTRHVVPGRNGLIWEVDVFEGAHWGPVIAEIELHDADTHFDRPDWLGAEATGDQCYYNASLAQGAARPGNRASLDTGQGPS